MILNLKPFAATLSLLEALYSLCFGLLDFRPSRQVKDIGPLLKSWVASDRYILLDISKLHLYRTRVYLFLTVMILEDLSK